MQTRSKNLAIDGFDLKRFARSVVLVVGVSCHGLIFCAYMFADRIIFQPPSPGYRDTSEVLKLTTAGGHRISAIYLPNRSAAYTVLYSHGNAEDLGTVRYKLEELQEMGFSVAGYDYEGYGTSEGAPSESAAYRDIDAVYDHLTGELNIPADRIILYGWSLGGAVAADLAARRPAAGLVLEGTFVSAFRVLTRAPLLPFDRFRTLSKLKQIECPVLVMHGEADEVIGIWHGRMLFDAANEPKQHLWIERAGHGDLALVASDQYRKAWQDFTRLLKP